LSAGFISALTLFGKYELNILGKIKKILNKYRKTKALSI